MSTEIFDNPFERQKVARRLLIEIKSETRGIIGFLGIGSFWGDGQLGQFGGSRKDIDLFAIVKNDRIGEIKTSDLIIKIKSKLEKEGIIGLEIDLGIIGFEDKFDVLSSSAPELLFVIRRSVLVCGKEPKNLARFRKSDLPTMFIG